MSKVKLILWASILVLSGQVNASLTTDGTLYRLTNPLITDSFTTVDKWYFSTLGGTSKIDVLSWETEPFDSSFLPVVPIDVNGDGEIAFFDSLIHIFRNDGVLDPTDWILSIDDDMGGFSGFGDPYCQRTPGIPAGFADGSIYHYDSCMETDLGVGDYILAIGTFNITIAEAIAGVGNNLGGVIEGTQTCISGSDPHSGGCFKNHPYGDYQITWSDNVIVTSNPDSTYIPAPPALLLFGTGLLGLIGFSKRRKAA